MGTEEHYGDTTYLKHDTSGTVGILTWEVRKEEPESDKLIPFLGGCPTIDDLLNII